MSIASRITAIEGHIADDYNALEYIGADLTNVDKNIENIKNVLADIYDDMPKVTDTGTDLTLENTRKGAMSITYKGETQQDSTTGKNLFDINGTLYSGSINKVNNGFKLIKDDTYRTLSIILTTPIPAGTYKCTYNVINSTLSDVNKVTITIRTDSSELANFKVNTNGENTFTINDTATRIYAYISTAEATDTYITLDNFMISVNGGDYEPYTNGASPNPDYPQPIHNVSGDNTITICKKNLFDKNDPLTTGYINPTGGINSSSNFSHTKYIPIKPNTTYTTSGMASGTGSEPSRAYYDSNKTFISAYRHASQTNIINTSPSNAYYMIESVKIVDLDTIQIEVNNEPTTYEAYTGNSQLISLGVENLFDKDNANIINCYINVGQNKVLDSTTNKSLYIPIIGGLTYTISKTKSDRFAVGTTATLPANDVSLIDEVDDNNATFLTINTSNTAKYLCVHYWRNSDTKTEQEILDSIQIEKGSKANSYTPYGASYIELNKISTYQDYIYKDNDRWFLHKEIGKVVLDGSENWNYFFSTAGVYVNRDSTSLDSASTINCLSNYYKATTRTQIRENLSTTNNECATHGTETLISNKDCLTVNDFKSWLSTHNTIFYYVLDTPTDTEITDTNLISQLETIKRSYDGVTNISQENNDLPFILDVSALKEWNNE